VNFLKFLIHPPASSQTTTVLTKVVAEAGLTSHPRSSSHSLSVSQSINSYHELPPHKLSHSLSVSLSVDSYHELPPHKPSHSRSTSFKGT